MKYHLRWENGPKCGAVGDTSRISEAKFKDLPFHQRCMRCTGYLHHVNRSNNFKSILRPTPFDDLPGHPGPAKRFTIYVPSGVRVLVERMADRRGKSVSRLITDLILEASRD